MMHRILEQAGQPEAPSISENAMAHHRQASDRILRPPEGTLDIPEDKSSHETYRRTQEGHLFTIFRTSILFSP